MSPSSGVPLYRNHDYVRLVLAQLLSIVGRETGAIVLPLLVLALTNSPAQVGWVAAVQSVPYLVLALPAGALVDRWSRKRTMFVCDALRLLALASVPCAWWLGWVAIAQLYAVALVTGVAFVFYNIAELAGLPLLVPKEQLPQAMSVNTVVEWTGELSAPALGGVLVGLGATMITGAMLAYGAQAGILALSLAALAGIANPLKVATGARAASSLWREMGEGLSWLLRHRVIRAFALLAMVQNILFSPVNIALIVLMRTAYRATPQEIGLFFAAAGVSGLVGTFIAPFVTRRLAIGRLIVLPVCLFAVGLSILPFAHTLWLTAAGWMMVTFSGSLGGVAVISYRLSLIPDAMQGRVNSVFRFIAWGVNPAMLAIGGVAVATIGARGTLAVIAGGMMLTAVAAAASFLRTLK